MSASILRYRGRRGAEQFREQVGEPFWDVDVDWSDAESALLSVHMFSLGARALVQRVSNASGRLQVGRAPERLVRAQRIAFGVTIVRRGVSRFLVEGRWLELHAGSIC